MSVVRLACCLVAALAPLPVTLAADPPKFTSGSPAWGKPVDGLQAGIRVKSDGPRTPTAAAELEVVIRNIGDEVVEFTHLSLTFTCYSRQPTRRSAH